MEAGNLDAAFVLEAPYPLPKTCDWLLLREEPLIVLAPAHLAHRDPHDLLANEPLIRFDRNQWGGRHAEEYLRQPRHPSARAVRAERAQRDRGDGRSRA